jgi:hypothetical protein
LNATTKLNSKINDVFNGTHIVSPFKQTTVCFLE